MKTENGIISPTFSPPIKNLLLQNIYNFYQSIQNWYRKQEMELCKQKIELFLLLPRNKEQGTRNEEQETKTKEETITRTGTKTWHLFDFANL